MDQGRKQVEAPTASARVVLKKTCVTLPPMRQFRSSQLVGLLLQRGLWKTFSIALLLTGLLQIIISLVLSLSGRSSALLAFPLIRQIRIVPSFYDLRWLLTFARCPEDNIRVLESGNTGCSFFENGQLISTSDPDYTVFSNLFFRLIKLPLSSIDYLAVLVIVCFLFAVITSAYFTFRKVSPLCILLTILICGYPVQILVERGNLDLPIYSMMTLAAYLSCFQRTYLKAALYGIVVFSIALKIYPAFGFIGLLLGAEWRKRNFQIYSKSSFLLILASIVSGLLIASPWKINPSSLTFAGGIGSFGLRASGYLNTAIVDAFGPHGGRFLIWTLVFSKLACLVVGLSLGLRNRKCFNASLLIQPDGPSITHIYNIHYFVMMSFTWLGCYILAISYDYKHIFLIPSLVLCVKQLFDGPPYYNASAKKISILYLTSCIFVFYVPIFHWGSMTIPAPFITFAEAAGEFCMLPVLAGVLGAILLDFIFPRDLTGNDKSKGLIEHSA